MRQSNIGYHLREGFRSIFTHGLMSFAAVCMIVACLIIMGTFSLVAVTLDNTLGKLEDQNAFNAYIDETYSRSQAQAMEEKLLNIPNVASVTFVAKETAKENYVDKYATSENQGIFKDLPNEVFRDRYLVHVKDIQQMGATSEAVKVMPGVADVQVELALAQGFVALRNVASAVAFILIAMMLVLSLFIIANTTKLATFHRREEISIMKMCGATNWFVRWPFIFEGMILGLMAAIVAFLLQWGIYFIIVKAITEFGGLALIVILPFETMAARVGLIFGVAGLLIGGGGSLLAIRKFLQV